MRQLSAAGAAWVRVTPAGQCGQPSTPELWAWLGVPQGRSNQQCAAEPECPAKPPTFFLMGSRSCADCFVSARPSARPSAQPSARPSAQPAALLSWQAPAVHSRPQQARQSRIYRLPAWSHPVLPVSPLEPAHLPTDGSRPPRNPPRKTMKLRNIPTQTGLMKIWPPWC